MELVATAFANLREGRTLNPLYGWQEVVLLAVLGGLLAVASWRWDPVRLLPVEVALSYLASVLLLFARSGLWLPQIVPVMVEMPLLMVGGTLLQYLHSRSLWREAVDAAASYVSPKAKAFYAKMGESGRMFCVAGRTARRRPVFRNTLRLVAMESSLALALDQ